MSLVLALAASAGAARPLEAPEPWELTLWQDVARCVVTRAPKRTAELLNSDFREQPAYHERMRALLNTQRSCFVNNTMRARGVVVPGFLAEASLRRETVTDPVAAVAFRPGGRVIAARDEGEATALCTVRKQPAEVWALLQTKPGQADEDAAIKSLVPTVGACTAEGTQAGFNKPGLRAVLALAYRRLLNSNKTMDGAVQ